MLGLRICRGDEVGYHNTPACVCTLLVSVACVAVYRRANDFRATGSAPNTDVRPDGRCEMIQSSLRAFLAPSSCSSPLPTRPPAHLSLIANCLSLYSAFATHTSRFSPLVSCVPYHSISVPPRHSLPAPHLSLLTSPLPLQPPPSPL